MAESTNDKEIKDVNKHYPFEPVEYTTEELNAMRSVRTALMEEHGIEESRVGRALLAVGTINCKLRVPEAVTKFKRLLDIAEKCGVTGFPDDDGDGNGLWKPDAVSELKAYEPCGVDHHGRSIIWTHGTGRTPVSEEKRHVEAAMMFFLANHADARSLHNGVTFVTDVSLGKDRGEKNGNEKKLQSLYQSMPQRPQAILIAGTNKVTRAVVNAIIKAASVFTKQKVLDRIKFVSVDAAKESVPIESAPKYVGGGGGGHENISDWIKERLEKFVLPDL